CERRTASGLARRASQSETSRPFMASAGASGQHELRVVLGLLDEVEAADCARSRPRLLIQVRLVQCKAARDPRRRVALWVTFSFAGPWVRLAAARAGRQPSPHGLGSRRGGPAGKTGPS